jgi:hypothetical protein
MVLGKWVMRMWVKLDYGWNSCQAVLNTTINFRFLLKTHNIFIRIDRLLTNQGRVCSMELIIELVSPSYCTPGGKTIATFGNS